MIPRENGPLDFVAFRNQISEVHMFQTTQSQKTTGWCKGICIYGITLTSNLLLDQKKNLTTPLQAEKKKYLAKKNTKTAPLSTFCHGWWPSFASPSHFGTLSGSPAAKKGRCCGPMLRPQFSLEKNITLKPICWTWIPSIILDFRDGLVCQATRWPKNLVINGVITQPF